MIFKILLIILVALPVIVFAVWAYLQVVAYVRDRNRAEKMRRRN